MGKLIIRHGERTTEHELSEAAVIIGRDPECELFFADKKLSRRHARFERDGSGFRVVDLDSRNGSWVNEERVRNRRLNAGDTIRLGSLHISFEQEEAVGHPDEEPTVYLPEVEAEVGAEAPEASSTLMLSGAPEPVPGEDSTGSLAPQDADDSSTVMLGRVPVEEPMAGSEPTSPFDGRVDATGEPPADDAEDSATRVLSAGEFDSARFETGDEEDSSTRMLSIDELGSSSNEPEDEASTRMAPGVAVVSDAEETVDKVASEALPEGDQTVLARGDTDRRVETGTVLFRAEVGDEARAEPVATDGSLGSAAEGDSQGLAPPQRSWTLSFALVTATLVLYALVVLVLPLASTSTRALDEEARTRGRLMMELLAAANETPLGEGRPGVTTVEAVESSPGVTGAFVLDTASRIVAPPTRAGEVLAIEGLDAGAVRSIRSGRTMDGDLFVAGPVAYRGRRVGVAVVTYRHPGSSVMAVLAIGCALLAMGSVAAVLYGRRLTLLPLQELRGDIESLEGLNGDTLVEHRAYREVSELAQAVNRVTLRAPGTGE